MRILYGVEGGYKDITDSLGSENKRLDIYSPYNHIFGDPAPSMMKHIKVEKEGLSRPIHVAENTPISILDDYTERNIHIVYRCNRSEIDIDSLRSITSSIHIASTYYESAYKMWELSRGDLSSVILHITSVGNCQLKRSLVDAVIGAIHDVRVLFDVLPNIHKMGHLHTIDGIVPHDIFWCRGAFITGRDPPVADMPDKYYSMWLSSSSYECLDIYPDVYLVGDCPTLSMIPLHNRDGGYINMDTNCIAIGLLNQLNNLATSLVIAHITGRDIYNPNFRPQYDKNVTIPLSNVIDLVDLNNTLSKMGLESRLIFSNEKMEWYNPGYDTGFSLIFEPLPSVIANVLPQPKELQLGCALPNTVSNFEALYIIDSMRFLPIYYEVAEYCKRVIGDDYIVVHLRMEDDWINLAYSTSDFKDISARIWSSYKEALSIYSRDTNIFVATHLGKSKNQNDYILNTFISMYPYTRTKVDWREKYDLPQGREIDALIDYLICLGGRSFIGANKSTFSTAIARVIKMNGGTATLV